MPIDIQGCRRVPAYCFPFVDTYKLTGRAQDVIKRVPRVTTSTKGPRAIDAFRYRVLEPFNKALVWAIGACNLALFAAFLFTRATERRIKGARFAGRCFQTLHASVS